MQNQANNYYLFAAGVMEHQDGGNCSGAAALRQCPFFQVGCPQRQVCIFADVHLFCISDTMFVIK